MKTAEEILKEWRKINMPKIPKHDYLQAMFTDKQLISLMDMHANQSKWISVEDRLPEINGHYLINENGCEIALFLNGLWKSIGKEERGVLSDFRKTLKPTHWQPLPTAP